MELWIEKETISIIAGVAEGFEVDAFPTRGFSSTTKLDEAARRIRDANGDDLEVHVLVLTDFDPSGDCISDKYSEKAKKYGADTEFTRLMITPEQISRYDLPAIPPDDPSYKRITKDPHYKGWVEECRQMGVPPRPIEIDAFAGLYPEEFREVIVGAVNQHYDVDAGNRDRETEKERLNLCRELAGRLRSLKK